jgi:hypothetical protein
MNPIEAITMALTPGTPLNQQNKVFRSVKALSQFANLDEGETLAAIVAELHDRVTIRPSNKRPQNGPLVALTEHIPPAEEGGPGVGPIAIMAGNAVAPLEGDEPLLQPFEDHLGAMGPNLGQKVAGQPLSYGQSVLEENPVDEDEEYDPEDEG